MPPKGQFWRDRVQQVTHNPDGSVNVPEGEELWKVALRRQYGRMAHHDPQTLLEGVCGYFNWLQSNALEEAKLVSYEGVSTLERIPRMRAPTLAGLCMYLGISREAWASKRRNPPSDQIADVIEFAESYMYEQKFTGAAAGLLNASIVSKDLGLVDKTEVAAGVTVNINGKDADL